MSARDAGLAEHKCDRCGLDLTGKAYRYKVSDDTSICLEHIDDNEDTAERPDESETL